MRRMFVGALALALGLASASCQFEDFKIVAIDGNCALVDVDGKPITELMVDNDDLVMWRNSSSELVKIIVSDAKVLSGRKSVRLSPGESTVIRVGKTVGLSRLVWYCGEDGGGGGTTPVETNGDSDG